LALSLCAPTFSLLALGPLCMCSISTRTHRSRAAGDILSVCQPPVSKDTGDYLFAKGLYSEGCNAAAAAGLKAAAEPTSGPSLEQDNRHILIISSIGHKEDLPPGRRRHHHHRADLCARQLMLLKILLFLSLGGLFEICMWWASVCVFACKQQKWKKAHRETDS
jgi:hypothetical protein